MKRLMGILLTSMIAVEMGYKVPSILVNGLEVADKKINQNQDEETE